MKATKEQRARLADGMRRQIELSPGAQKGYAARGLSDMRFRWDCFHAMKGLDGFADLSRDFYNAGLADSHIDTALREAVRATWGEL